MRGLRLVILSDEHARVHGALSLAVSAAALGRPVGVFFQGVAVRAIAGDRCWADDPPLRAAGIATVTDLIAQCAELGISLTACETGLHMTGVRAKGMREGIETSGLIGFLSEDRDAEIVTA